MSEYYYIEKSKQQIQAKENWEHWSKWTHYNFERLAKNIFDSTHIMLGVSTLKRYFVKTNASITSFNPQMATKHAIAKYLRCIDWEDFRKQNSIHENKESGETKSKIPIKSKYKIAATLFIIALIGLTIYFIANNKNIIIPLTVDNSVAACPSTIIFKYNIKDINEDSVFISFGRKAIRLLEKKDSTIAHSYFIPGYYTVFIYSKKREYATVNVLITNSSWNGYLKLEGEYYTQIKNCILDSTLKIDETEIPEKMLAENYQTEFMLFNKLNVSLDSLKIETRIKCNYKDPNQFFCNIASIKLFGDNENLRVGFTDKHCFDFSYFLVANNSLTGDQKKELGFDLNTWHDVAIEIKDQMAILLLDKKEIKRIQYKLPMGKYKGIFFSFTKTGAVDYVRIFKKGEEIYTNDFNLKK